MSIHSEIESTLRHLGSAEPPPGLQQRVQLGLRNPPRRFPTAIVYVVSGGALAASVAISAVALNPALHRLVFSQTAPIQNRGNIPTPLLGSPASGGFGPASVKHVPLQPVPVQPTPINQGRGRSRPGRSTLPNGSLAPLPRGVAPGQPLAATGTGVH